MISRAEVDKRPGRSVPAAGPTPAAGRAGHPAACAAAARSPAALPAYRVAVVDRRHAWLFAIAGERIETTVLPTAEGLRSHGFSGWYGLEAYRVNDRIIELARHHYREVAAPALLQHASRVSGPQPLVIAGQNETVAQFLAVLPTGLRNQFAGRFVADTHALTPARVRDFAERVMADWVSARGQLLADQILQQPPDGLTATGLGACLAAASEHAIEVVLVPAGGLVPGYACQECGALSSTPCGCPHGPGASLAVPDLIEEVAVSALSNGGRVETLTDPPAGVAARLRFPCLWQAGEPDRDPVRNSRRLRG
jgi:Bacterial archaeo-eukaryotic release factor family 10